MAVASLGHDKEPNLDIIVLAQAVRLTNFLVHGGMHFFVRQVKMR